jgi:hypothetical protein
LTLLDDSRSALNSTQQTTALAVCKVPRPQGNSVIAGPLSRHYSGRSTKKTL